MATPPGNYDGLDALSAATPASAPAPDSTTQAALPPATDAAISFGSTGAPSVAVPGFYITADDTIQLTVWNSNPALTTVTMQLRVIKPDGTLIIQQQALNGITADRTANVAVLQEMDGFIVGVTIGPPGVAIARGQTYVRLAVVRGTLAAPIMQVVLLSDYVSSAFQPAWPAGRVLSAVEDAGWITTLNGTQPPVKADATIQQPASARWRLQSAQIQVNTVATAGARHFQFIISHGGNQMFFGSAAADQPANVGVQYNLAPGLPTQAVSPTVQTLALPIDLIVSQQALLSTAVLGMLTGDQVGGIVLAYEEWIDV
jgi:hypothetical protein